MFFHTRLLYEIRQENYEVRQAMNKVLQISDVHVEFSFLSLCIC